jgi:hypothetical protein
MYATSWRDKATAAQIKTLEEVCCPANDMKDEEAGRAASVPGWEGISTLKYTYHWKKFPQERLVVILLDPEAAKAADWVGNATLDVLGRYEPDIALKLAKHIRFQESGFHFPVRGFVNEGEYGLYLFKDGIAVKVDENVIPRKGLDSFEVRPGLIITDKMRASALDLPSTIILSTGRYARPASTSPEEFHNLRPHPANDGERWNPDDSARRTRRLGARIAMNWLPGCSRYTLILDSHSPIGFYGQKRIPSRVTNLGHICIPDCLLFGCVEYIQHTRPFCEANP